MKILLMQSGDVMLKQDIENKILNKLSDKRIFDVELLEGKRLLAVYERCDDYFGIDLIKKEVVQLIAELQTIADKMID